VDELACLVAEGQDANAMLVELSNYLLHDGWFIRRWCGLRYA